MTIPSPKFTAWMLIILLTAAVFRLVALMDVPPGLTHDEAGHGITALAILDGAREVYFTIGYGREPLYDYATAAVMAGLGPTYLAGRLTAAFFSLLLVAGMAIWVRRAFDMPVALLTAVGLAVGFWPVMAGRQALRSITLPALFVFAVYFFWRGLERNRTRITRIERIGEDQKGKSELIGANLWFPFVVAGLFLGLTFYTYIPARVLWLVFPAVVGYVALAARAWLPRLWGYLAMMLLVAAVVALPLALHLLNNPGLEVRISELSAPLQAAVGGNFTPLLTNVTGSLRLFMIEGDTAWRYNIAGRPWLGPVAGVLFVIGLFVAGVLAARDVLRHQVWPQREAGSFLALTWLAAGLAPVLVTGPELAMTQAIGMMPVLYLFPALALVTGYRWLARRPVFQTGSQAGKPALRWAAIVMGIVLVAGTAFVTWRDFFGRWANHPQVRVQYETTLMTALDYLSTSGDAGRAAVSTTTPHPYHSPAVAQLVVGEDTQPRWFDGRQSLLLPNANDGTLIMPGFTPLPGPLAAYLSAAELEAELPLRPDDLDRPLRVYRLDPAGTQAAMGDHLTAQTDDGPLPVAIGDALFLTGYELLSPAAEPGDEIQLVTAWTLQRPLPEAMLFAQLLGPEGIVAQDDALGAPGELWQAGDTLLQLHRLALPDELPAGSYPLIVGVYSTGDGHRLIVDGGTADFLTLTTLEVGE